jgi:hypothetical protein
VISNFLVVVVVVDYFTINNIAKSIGALFDNDEEVIRNIRNAIKEVKFQANKDNELLGNIYLGWSMQSLSMYFPNYLSKFNHLDLAYQISGKYIVLRSIKGSFRLNVYEKALKDLGHDLKTAYFCSNFKLQNEWSICKYVKIISMEMNNLLNNVLGCIDPVYVKIFNGIKSITETKGHINFHSDEDYEKVINMFTQKKYYDKVYDIYITPNKVVKKVSITFYYYFILTNNNRSLTKKNNCYMLTMEDSFSNINYCYHINISLVEIMNNNILCYKEILWNFTYIIYTSCYQVNKVCEWFFLLCVYYNVLLHTTFIKYYVKRLIYYKMMKYYELIHSIFIVILKSKKLILLIINWIKLWLVICIYNNDTINSNYHQASKFFYIISSLYWIINSIWIILLYKLIIIYIYEVINYVYQLVIKLYRYKEYIKKRWKHNNKIFIKDILYIIYLITIWNIIISLVIMSMLAIIYIFIICLIMIRILIKYINRTNSILIIYYIYERIR